MNESNTETAAPERDRAPRVGGAYVIDQESGERRLVQQTQPAALEVTVSSAPEGAPSRRTRTKE